MEVFSTQDCPGAEIREDSWISWLSFGPNEGMAEDLFIQALERSNMHAFPDDLSKYALLGVWNETRVINFILGRDERPRKPKPLTSSAVTIETGDYL